VLIRPVLVVGVVLVAAACSAQHAGPSALRSPPASGTLSATGSGAGSTTGTSTRAGSPSAAPATRPASYREQMLAWGRRFAQCVRQQGYPHFPDPVFKRGDGTINFPDYLDYPGADQVLKVLGDKCDALYKQMPPAPPPRVPPSAETLRQMRAFSQCLRDHGVTEFPDPKADGTFPILGTPMQVFAPGYIAHLPPNLEQAWEACFDLQINWRMQAS
jgi:hypothetical protein